MDPITAPLRGGFGKDWSGLFFIMFLRQLSKSGPHTKYFTSIGTFLGDEKMLVFEGWVFETPFLLKNLNPDPNGQYQKGDNYSHLDHVKIKFK